MLVDTDVIIWYMKGNEKARQVIGSIDRLNLSVVSYLELVLGLRNKQEFVLFRKSLLNWYAEIIQISEEISMKAMLLVEQHYLSHSLKMADALIAATAITYGQPLLTGNAKHYSVITNLQISHFRPA